MFSWLSKTLNPAATSSKEWHAQGSKTLTGVTDIDKAMLEDMIISQAKARNLPDIDKPAATSLIAAVQYLTENALTDEGLYRIAGNAKEIETLSELMRKGECNKEMLDGYDHFTIADAIKQCLRLTYGPLIPYSIFGEVLSAGPDAEALSMVLLDVPEPQLGALTAICSHLHQVDLNSDINLMTSTNLAITIGQHLLRPEAKDDFPGFEFKNRAAIISILITKFSDIFVGQKKLAKKTSLVVDASYLQSLLNKMEAEKMHGVRNRHLSTSVFKEQTLSKSPRSALSDEEAETSPTIHMENKEHDSIKIKGKFAFKRSNSATTAAGRENAFTLTPASSAVRRTSEVDEPDDIMKKFREVTAKWKLEKEALKAKLDAQKAAYESKLPNLLKTVPPEFHHLFTLRSSDEFEPHHELEYQIAKYTKKELTDAWESLSNVATASFPEPQSNSLDHRFLISSGITKEKMEQYLKEEIANENDNNDEDFTDDLVFNMLSHEQLSGYRKAKRDFLKQVSAFEKRYPQRL